ncbi:hypothetical protein QQF64_006272 [Cirrhinus molitorella]|uniref:Uncharacterized protein n=1 Tax=Cirrhinus molitorella TaxID=172907 RepID=A0ABR3MEM3_9TELE
MESVGRSDKVQPEERSPEAMVGRCPNRPEPEGRGSPVELVDQWVKVETREISAMVEPLGQRAEAESWTQKLGVEMRDPPALTPDGNWQTRGVPTAQMVG